MKKYSLFYIPVILIILTLTSCESYIAFEVKRIKFLFFGTLIIGLIGLILNNKK